MKANISKKEVESKKELLEILSKTDSLLIPHKLKKIIPGYKKFKHHQSKKEIWSSSKNNLTDHYSKYDKVFILYNGIAASGKDAIRQEISRAYPELTSTIITSTSRKPRIGETDGIDYNFIDTPKNFKKSIRDGDFLEWIKQGDRFYGLSKKSLQTAIDHPAPIIFSQIEISAWTTFENHIKTVTNGRIFVLKIFVLPHMSFSEYKNWLNQKRDDDVETRLIRTSWEITKAPKKADFIVVNKIGKNKRPLKRTAKLMTDQILEFLSF
jgi:guanylate kinase